MQQVELAIQVFEPLVQIGQIDEHGTGFMVIGKPDDTSVHPLPASIMRNMVSTWSFFSLFMPP